MSFGEKLQSGLARGIEKVGGALFLGNMANQAKSDRIEKETAYFAQKEKRKPKNLENTVEINISEASFAENDPENYQKYQAEKLKIAKDYLEKNPPRTKSTGSMNAARKRAMMHAKTMAAQKFRKEIEAAGAGSVKGGISAQDTTPTPNTTPNVEFDGKTMGEVTGEFAGMEPMEAPTPARAPAPVRAESSNTTPNVKLDSKTKATGWKPSASGEMSDAEMSIDMRKNDPKAYEEFEKRKLEIFNEKTKKYKNGKMGTITRNRIAKEADAEAWSETMAKYKGNQSNEKNSGISWQGIKDSVSGFFGFGKKTIKLKEYKERILLINFKVVEP